MEEHFNIFYASYPRHTHRRDAFKSYLKAIKDGATHEQIMDGVERYKRHIASNNTEFRFVKHPATFLNAWSFDDEYELNLPKESPFTVRVGEKMSDARERWERQGLVN